MNKQDIIKIIKKGESLTVEFKTAKNKLPKDLFETVCAFLNTKGGTILLGVDDNGDIIGVDKNKLSQLKKDIANLSNNPQKISPVFFIKINEHIIEGKNIISVEIPESPQVHNTNGNIFVRNQDGDYKVIHPVQIAKIVNRKQNYHTEQIVFDRITINDLNSKLIERAKHLIKLNNPDNHWWELSNSKFLLKPGLYRKKENGKAGITLAAVLFFGTDELIQSLLPAYKFEALLRREKIDRYDDRLTVRTNIIDAYDLLMSFINKHLNDPFYLEGDTRISLRSKIFRELVANIISHREYLSPQQAFINIFKDKIEFINPNNPTVFGKIDPEHFTPVAKNPIINKLMIQMGRAEDIGSGIRNVIKYLPLYQKNASVEFIDGELFSTIINLNGYDRISLNSKKEIPEEQVGVKVGVKVGVNEGKIFKLIKENNHITYKELAEKVGISEKSIYKNINKLKKKNLIKRVGSDKTGYWEIIIKG